MNYELKIGDTLEINGKHYYVSQQGVVLSCDNRRCRKEPEAVIREVCKVFGVREEEIKSPSRKRYVVNARRLFCYIMSEHSSYTTTQIGEFINRHHPNVLYHIKEYTALMRLYREFRDAYEIVVAIVCHE